MANVWLDRFSGPSTPSGSPPPQNRSFSPAPRRPSHLGLGAAARPGFKPRSSSLNVAKFDSSTTSLNSPRLPNGSGLKQQITPPGDFTDPLKVLEKVVGKPLTEDRTYDEGVGAEKPSELTQDIDFGELSLHDFLLDEDGGGIYVTDVAEQSTEECEYVCSDSMRRVSGAESVQMKETRINSRTFIDQF